MMIATIRCIEIPLRDALKRYPNLLPMVLVSGVDPEDEEYIVRIAGDFVEIGYREDDWMIAA